MLLSCKNLSIAMWAHVDRLPYVRTLKGLYVRNRYRTPGKQKRFRDYRLVLMYLIAVTLLVIYIMNGMMSEILQHEQRRAAKMVSIK